MNTKRLGGLQIGILLLGIAASLIHFYLNVLMGKLDILFTLNGLGYLGLLGALFLPFPFLLRYRSLARYALMAFTLVTLLAWALIGDRGWLGWTSAGVELALIIVLFRLRP